MILNRDRLQAEMIGVAHARLTMSADDDNLRDVALEVAEILDAIYAIDEAHFKRVYNLTCVSRGFEPKFKVEGDEEELTQAQEETITQRLEKFAITRERNLTHGS